MSRSDAFGPLNLLLRQSVGEQQAQRVSAIAPSTLHTIDPVNWGPIVEQQYAVGGLPPGVPADFGYVLDGVHVQSQKALADLVPPCQPRDTGSASRPGRKAPPAGCQARP